MPAKFWRVFLCPDPITRDSIMPLEKLLNIKDNGVGTPDNLRVGQTLLNSGTDSCGLVVVERGRFLRDWDQR